MTTHSLANSPQNNNDDAGSLIYAEAVKSILRARIDRQIEATLPGGRAAPKDEIDWTAWQCANRDLPDEVILAHFGRAVDAAGLTRASFLGLVAKKRQEVARLKIETPDGRKKVKVVPATHETIDDLDEVLGQCGPEMPIYVSGQRLVEPLPDDDGRLVISEIAPPCLASKISRFVQFVAPKKDEPGITYPIAPPTEIMADLHARRSWPSLRRLRGIVTCPTLRPDLSVIRAPGYDPVTHLYYEPRGAKFPTVPDAPTAAEVRAAVATLQDLIVDFPFGGEADRSAAIGLILRLLAGVAVDGPTPLQVVLSHSPRVGKGKLLEVICTATLGYAPASITYTPVVEEMRKRLFSVALQAPPIAILDNLPSGGQIGDAVLDGALTATRLGDRPLGVSRYVEVPWHTVLAATSNNPSFRADTAPRTQQIRLHTDLEHPESRTDFRHQQPAYAQAQRPAVVAAGLTLLRGFGHAGCPDQKIETWGSYEGYSRLIRQTLVWADLADPIAARVPSESDTTRDFLGRLLEEMVRLDPNNKGLTTTDLITPRGLIGRQSCLLEILESVIPAGARLSAVAVGKNLRAHIGRVVDGRRLVERRIGGLTRWFVERVGASAEEAA